MIDYYEKGRQDRSAWDTSPIYAQFDRDVPPDVVMKQFMPPIENDMMLVSRPMPKSHSEWLRGFKNE